MFAPWLIPEITRSGRSGNNLCSATITASAGVPSTAQCRSRFACTTIGRRNVNDCAAPLCSANGATILTVAKSSNASASTRSPSAPYPSSFVSRTLGILALLAGTRAASFRGFLFYRVEVFVYIATNWRQREFPAICQIKIALYKRRLPVQLFLGHFVVHAFVFVGQISQQFVQIQSERRCVLFIVEAELFL